MAKEIVNRTMRTTKYDHGTAFVESFTVTLRGEVDQQPFGCSDANSQKRFLEQLLHLSVKEAIAQFYQCRLHGTSIEIQLLPSHEIVSNPH